MINREARVQPAGRIDRKIRRTSLDPKPAPESPSRSPERPATDTSVQLDCRTAGHPERDVPDADRQRERDRLPTGCQLREVNLDTPDRPPIAERYRLDTERAGDKMTDSPLESRP